MAETDPAAPNPQPPAAPPKPPKAPKAPPPTDTPPAEPTDADRKAIADKAVDDYKRQQADAERQRQADVDRKAAEARGEFDQVKAGLERERDDARTAARAAQVELRVYRAVAKDHPDYLPAVDWIRRGVEFASDTTDATLDNRIGEAVAAYVRDNPRAKPAEGRATAAAPASPANRQPTDRRPSERKRTEPSIAAARY